MNPVEWHQFLSSLVRDGPGTVAAALIAAVVGVAVCHWWLRGDFKKKLHELKLKNEHQNESYNFAMRKLSQALQELGITRERLIVSQEEARRYADEAARLNKEVAELRKAIEAFGPAADDQEASAARARLETENRELVEGKETLEKAVKELQEELNQVRGELAHSAKWLKVFGDENARLTKDESVGAP